MIRLLVRTAVAVAANAVGLLVAAALLDGVHLDGVAFLVAVVIFTVAFALLQPFSSSSSAGSERPRSSPRRCWRRSSR